jgi:hypothetical protein
MLLCKSSVTPPRAVYSLSHCRPNTADAVVAAADDNDEGNEIDADDRSDGGDRGGENGANLALLFNWQRKCKDASNGCRMGQRETSISDSRFFKLMVIFITRHHRTEHCRLQCYDSCTRA